MIIDGGSRVTSRGYRAPREDDARRQPERQNVQASTLPERIASAAIFVITSRFRFLEAVLTDVEYSMIERKIVKEVEHILQEK